MLKDLLRQLRKDKGLNQIDLAQRVGVSIDSVRRWEAGKREPRLGELEKIALVLEVPVTSLVMGREENKNTPSPKEERGISNIQFDNKFLRAYAITMYNYSNLYLHGEAYPTMEPDGSRYISPEYVFAQRDEKRPPFLVRQDRSFSISQTVPAIAVDDDILIDPSAGFVSDRIYLVCLDGHDSVCRVTSVEGGGYQLEHDKGRQFVSPQMVEDKRFFIVGSVVESFPRSKVVS
ncbi:helix-turn-helix transcriptional regulator [Pyramidobacter sp.]|uniref:helix-turn-helix domain-containing protein n=1 Tax=Pyramidobacter sp. TaxID=1943581 RepID=UPI00332A5317